jgi:hypothetical protein
MGNRTLFTRAVIRKLIVAVCIVSPFVFFAIIAVLADYIGPKNRVGPDQVVCNEVYRFASGPYQGQFACVMPCGEPEYYQQMCGSECAGGCTSSQQYSTIPGPNLPYAAIAGTLNCSLPGNNGWCRGSSTLSLAGSEPVSGYSILSLEGTRNGAFFTC